MENNQLLEGLSNYVNGQDQFAVMIDGPWGSGKTYFLKKTVIPYVREEHKVVYFSVYGYESLTKLKSDLIGDLFISSLGKGLDETDTRTKVEDIVSLTKGVVNVVGEKLAAFKSLANTAESLIIKKQLAAKGWDSAPVLIIDDLERISREVHTSDLMGFLLTDVIESYGYRVIIVGNTQEIRKDESDEFSLTREKVVSRIFPFTYDFNNIKEEFFSNSGIDFLRDDSDWLVGILAEYIRHNEGQLNLRTLEFILTTFKIIDDALSQYWDTNSVGKSDSNQIKRSVFANLFVIATEYREGRLTRENLSIIDSLLNTRSFFFLHIKDDEEKSTAEKITIRYHDDENLRQVIMYDNSVNNAIFNGVFDAHIFIDDWMKLFKPQKMVSNADKISHFRDMTDSQLEVLEHELLHDSLSQVATVGDILATINSFLFFDQNNLNFCGTNYLSELLGALKNVVSKSLHGNVPLYDRSDIGFRYSVLAKSEDPLKQVQTILESAEKAKHNLSTEELVDAIFKDDHESIRDISQSGLRTNIFRAILDSEHLEKDLLTTGSKAHMLDRYLNSEYIRISNSKDFHNGENPDITELIREIQKFTNESTQIGQIDRFNLKGLLTTLKAILDKFSK